MSVKNPQAHPTVKILGQLIQPLRRAISKNSVLGLSAAIVKVAYKVN